MSVPAFFGVLGIGSFCVLMYSFWGLPLTTGLNCPRSMAILACAKPCTDREGWQGCHKDKLIMGTQLHRNDRIFDIWLALNNPLFLLYGGVC